MTNGLEVQNGPLPSQLSSRRTILPRTKLLKGLLGVRVIRAPSCSRTESWPGAQHRRHPARGSPEQAQRPGARRGANEGHSGTERKREQKSGGVVGFMEWW